jgi:hypothetical protein
MITLVTGGSFGGQIAREALQPALSRWLAGVG